MEINFDLHEKDYLNFQLYHTSIDPNVKKQRRNTQLTVSILLLALGIFFLVRGEQITGYYFIVGAIPAYFLCAFYTKWLYKLSLKRHVANSYRKTTPRNVTLSIANDEIEYRERGLTKNEKVSSLAQIIETKDYIYFQFNQISYIIIPKEQLSDAEYIKNLIQSEAEKHNIPFDKKIKWKWK